MFTVNVYSSVLGLSNAVISKRKDEDRMEAFSL